VISDVLSDAVGEIDDYLAADDTGNYAAEPALLAWIIDTRNTMETLRCVLDTMPDGSKPEERECPVARPT
jgi:hypothetical protein